MEKRLQELRDRMLATAIPEPNSGCLIWMGQVHEGYGRFMINKKKFRAHRIAYVLFKGPVPADTHVLHKCDTPLCVEPNHLYLGTDEDNVRDMHARGRAHKARGYRGRFSKVSPDAS